MTHIIRTTNDVNCTTSYYYTMRQTLPFMPDPIVKEYDGFPIAMVPWINPENYADTGRVYADSCSKQVGVWVTLK